MFFRYIGLVVTFVLSLHSALYAVNDDLCIAYRVPPCVKQKFFNHIIDQAVPGKTKPDSYHVTLMLVKDTKLNPQHHNALKARLLAIRDQSLSSAHFTPGFVSHLQPANAIVIESNNVNENQQFKHMNSLLYSEVLQFNLQNGTAYKVQPFLEPNHYRPHLTIALRAHITAHGLNPQQVIQDVNVKLANYTNSNRAPFDLLQVNQPVAPPAAPPLAQPVSPAVVPPVVQHKKMRQTTTKSTVRVRQTRHRTKRSTIRVRQTRQATKRSTMRVKHMRQTHKHRRLSHSRRRR